MPRKVYYQKPWEAPKKSEVRDVCAKIGNYADVSRLLCKNINTIKRWCNDYEPSKIDKANWKMLKTEAEIV